MRELRFGRALQLRDDAPGEHLAELHPPLVKRVDLPDRALSKDDVLIEGNELPQGLRGQPVKEDRGGGPVALECPVRRKVSGVFSARTSCEVLPKARASACAKTFASRRSW